MLRSSCWNRKSFRAAAEFREVLRDTGWLLVEANNSSLTDECLIFCALLNAIFYSKRGWSIGPLMKNRLARLHHWR